MYKFGLSIGNGKINMLITEQKMQKIVDMSIRNSLAIHIKSLLQRSVAIVGQNR